MTSTATDTPLTSLPSDDDFSDGDLASLPVSPTSGRVSPAPPIESLVAGRARRANAGNLLHKLITQEADEEDTLFLEDEDDVEFEVKEKEDPSDVQLESSDEDDDDFQAKDEEDIDEEFNTPDESVDSDAGEADTAEPSKKTKKKKKAAKADDDDDDDNDNDDDDKRLKKAKVDV